MIHVENLTKKYGNFLAVDDISFKILTKEVVALLGLNGAGKTTTLRMLTGYVTPTKGDIHINHYSLIDQPMKLKQQIGYMPENPALYLDHTVKEFLTYIYRLRMYTKHNEDEAVKLSMQKVNVQHRANDTIGSLSAGFKKRVALAQALVHNPSVLIFDEPISDLDPRQIVEMRNLILKLKANHTLLVSSHILSEISQIADRYLFINNGKLIAEETPESLEKYLEGGFSYEIETQKTASGNLKSKIKTLDGVNSVEIEEKSDSLFISVGAKSDLRSELSKLIVNSNIDLLQIKQVEMDLEKLFISLTSKKA